MSWSLAVSRMAVVGAVVGSTACGGDANANAADPDPFPVRTVPVTITTEADPIRTSGTVASRAEMSLAFKIPGYVAEVLVSEGDRVREGQVMARLRTDEVDAQVRAAEAQARLASRNLERMERLVADSVVTQATLEEAEDAHERAQAALEVARFNQEFATIRAPSDARVLSRSIEESEFTGAGTPAFRVGATASGWVVQLSVTDRQVVRLAVGDDAEVSLAALGDDPIVAVVSEIADAADPRTGTFAVEVTLRSEDARLRSGMVARVTIVPSAVEALSFLPSQSLVETDGLDAVVFVVNGDRVRRRPVRVVRIGPERIGVFAPDLEGATVVTDGAAYLRDGDRIEDRTADMQGPS